MQPAASQAIRPRNLGLWVWQVAQDVVTWENDVPYDLFGIARSEAPITAARFKTEFLHPEDLLEFDTAVGRAMNSHGAFSFAGRIRRADGKWRWLEFTGRVCRSGDGGVDQIAGIAADITDSQVAEDALRSSRAQADRQRRVYEAILSNTPDFAYVFDLNHCFSYANENLLKMFGKSWDETIGKPLVDIGYEPWHAEMHQREIDEVVATRRPVRGEVPFHGTFGRRIYDYIFVPVFGANGEVEAVAGTTRDVTERKEVEAAREALLVQERAAREEAQRASLMKEEFLAMLSHELRTPINAILGWTQILRRRPPNPEMLEQGLSVIDRNARMQTQLISDLLDMSRIVSGKMHLEVEPVELPAIISAAVDGVRPSADAKGVELSVSIEPVIDVVNGDPVRLQQVIWNLLVNAVKFTPRGGKIAVALTCRRDGVEITVRDTGKGIKPEFLPLVFDRFRQADNSSTREFGGLGLGLAIVKQLAELHGGSVQAQSGGDDAGACFSVRLPFAPLRSTANEHVHEPPVAMSVSAKYDPPNLTGLRVLVVDDEADARDLIRIVLEECGATVAMADGADRALAALLGAPADVILSDIGMPERDGYALMTAVRQHGIKTPAAALTAFAASADRMRALQAGYQTHITKPVETVELLATVAALAQKTS